MDAQKSSSSLNLHTEVETWVHIYFVYLYFTNVSLA